MSDATPEECRVYACTHADPMCRHCAHMTCGDANWCDEHRRTYSDAYVARSHPCAEYEANPIDALLLEDWTERWYARELAKRAIALIDADQYTIYGLGGMTWSR